MTGEEDGLATRQPLRPPLRDLARREREERFGLAATVQSTFKRPAHFDGIIYRRKSEPKGPMTGFGYSWLDDRLEKAKLPRPALFDREASRDGPSFAYEALNLVDGERSVQDIGNQLTATVGPVPIKEVADFLATLQRVGLLEVR